MKRTTYFRPSIHGWPFGNNYDWTIELPFPEYEITLTGVGFCGGMCWTALDRFYSGIRLPRDIPAPSQGDSYYNEILQEQVASVADVGKLLRMWCWQNSPKLSGHWGNPHQSLGSRTMVEWQYVRASLSYLSPHHSKPTTLTLIRTSNDYDFNHLKQHHRVVAYGYEERELEVNEYVRGETNSQIRHIKLYIYDPKYPNDDDVYLTFYINCDDDWISLRHRNYSNGERVAGFFVDDIGRNYTSDVYPVLYIQKVELTEITSASRASFDLQFWWKCRVIPYFCIQVDGVDWQYNESVQESYLPVGNIKQCPTKTGSMTVNLELPRDPSTVTVRFLGDDSFTASKVVSVGEPVFRFLPYFWLQDEPISEQDFYFEERDPSESALEELSSPNSRIVHIQFPAAKIDSDIAFPWPEMQGEGRPFFIGITLPTKRFLGNIAKALHANFIVENLALPAEFSATVTTIKNGQTTATDSLSSLSNEGACLFDGFSSADYDDDTEVNITVKCTDKYGVVLEDQVSLHGKSILVFSQGTESIDLPQPGARRLPKFYEIIPIENIARYEEVVHKLVEIGLLDLNAELQPSFEPESLRIPTDPRLSPRPIETDSVALLRAFRSDRRLQRMIDKSSYEVWHDRDMWAECLKHHSKVLSQEYQGGVTLYHSLDKIDGMAALREHEAEIQRKSDAVIIGAFAEKIIQVLRQNPAVKRALKLL